MLRELGKQNSILNRFMAEMRDINIQKDSMRFRRNLERVGEIFAYEISKELNYETVNVQTPLGIADIPLYKDKLVLSVILRAGLPLHQGMLNYFDNAENAFISAYRKYGKDNKFSIQIEHVSCPSIEKKVLVICDPMLATGSSIALVYDVLLKKGAPLHTHIVAPIASREGVDYILEHMFPEDVTLWVGAIDEELTLKSYIIPGLGDAGDLAYGSKI
ncbi:MAG: uracil phosphoribosyltransferase [Prevotellaceae bacterium]|jgi:uracil phosphoribosyltransferase|nr:uracil phosphoribosyltransferase [Prevotellaceae bacterium]